MDQIPKIIHYIWFGGGPHSNTQNRCIESWRHYAPEFEIIRWDESNCNIGENPYVAEAYNAKKWAFVSDYFRFKILVQHGGIYMDTDTELHQSIDSLLKHTGFFAFEKWDVVHGGIIGAVPEHTSVVNILGTYNQELFTEKNGIPNLSAVPVRITKVLREQGLKLNGKQQELSDGTAIYSVNALTLDLGDGKCIAEHHYEYTWAEAFVDIPYKYYLTREYFRSIWVLRFVKALKWVVIALGLKEVFMPIYRWLRRD